MATFKRKVFYIGGFDPRGVRFYHGLYKEAVTCWTGLTGETVTVSPRKRASAVRTDWTVVNATQDAETSYSFLRWEDIVQRAWVRNPVALAAQAVRTYWGLARNIDMRVIRAVPKWPVFTLFFPPVISVLLPLLIGLIPFLVAAIWLPWWAALAIGAAVGIGVAGPLLKKAHTPWLLRFFAFNAERAGGESDPELAARLDAFADEILGEIDEEWDEILLVTHSNGSILAVPLMCRLLERRGGDLPDSFTLLTLGQCIPLIICRRDATRFHDQVRVLGRAHFHWLDIGSPPDGAAFHCVNPMLMVGPDSFPHLEQLSPRFHLFYDPESYHSGWANKYDIHFDYLRVGDRISPLDYPSITATRRPIDQSVDAFRAL